MSGVRDPVVEHGGGVRVVLEVRDPAASGPRRGILVDPDGKAADEPVDLPPRAGGLEIGADLAARILRASARVATRLVGAAADCGFVRLTERLVPAAPAPPGEGKRLEDLAAAIPQTPAAAGGPTVPAAYTYFGQFVAHELTYARVMHDPGGGDGTRYLAQGAKLDLATLRPAMETKFAGPKVDTANGIWLGRTTADNLRDLPRAAGGAPQIADPRNDANLALAQMHVAIARFARSAGGLDKALPLVQEVALFDWLGRLCDGEVHGCVMTHGRALMDPDPDTGTFILPAMVATAALRFGHAMVRFSYSPWNRNLSALVDDLLKYTHRGVGGRKITDRLPDGWAAKWPDLSDQGGNSSLPLSPVLNDAMRKLPGEILPHPRPRPRSSIWCVTPCGKDTNAGTRRRRRFWPGRRAGWPLPSPRGSALSN